MNTVGHPYPTEFPLAELRRLIGFARGTLTFDLKAAVHDAYHVLGYALGTMIGDVPTPIGAPSTVLFVGATELAADELQKAVDAHAVAGAGPVGFDWAALIPVLVRLIQRWLDARG